jgi:hypothetical protein
MKQWLDEHAKAVVSALTTGLVMFFTLRTNGMTNDEWLSIVSAVLAAGGLTYYVPNSTSKTTTIASTPTSLQVTETTPGIVGKHERTLAENRAEVAP